MRALFAALLAALIVAASERAVAEVTVLSQQGFAEASAGGINLDAPVNDFDTRSDTSLFESFSANVTAVASGDAFPIGDGDLVANAADGGVSTSVQVSRSANEIRVASTTQASAGGSRSSALPLRLNTGGSGSAFFSLQVRVTDRPARFRFEMLSQTVSGSGFGNSVNSGADVTFIPPVGIPRTAIACGPDGCDAGEPYVVSRVLQPGTYDFFIQTSATASPTSGTVEAAASCSYTLVISDAECDLTWNEFGSGGLFSDPANWSPQQAPQDDGAGCNNLLIARNGTFTVAVSGDQRANSMEVRSDAMTL